MEVLKGVDLAVADGEIHALLGANGAGKSTLIKCLSGAIQPDSGGLLVGTDRYHSLTPRTAREAGIAVIYQDPALAGSLNVADNIFLGREKRWGPFVRNAIQLEEAAHWLHQLDPGINPKSKLSSLGNAGVQTVEIARSLSMSPKVLILDEPTAALSEREAEVLGRQLLELKKQKLPILYITHRLGEVFALADRVTVLRGGRSVLSGKVENFAQEEIVSAIAGETLDRSRPAYSAPRPTAVAIDNLVAAGIGPVNLTVGRGEVLGVFGLVGSGRTELLETIFGARKIHTGSIRIEGKEVTVQSPADAVRQGIALVPSDRLRKSVIGPLAARDNMLLPSLAKLSWLGMRRPSRERAAFFQSVDPLNLQPRRDDLEAQRFSGGNQQKLVIARWMNDTQHCQLLLLDEPTQGVDVGARRDIYDALRASASKGNSLIVTSSEPEELLQLADRVIVLSHGRVVGTLTGPELSEANMLSIAHGITSTEIS